MAEIKWIGNGSNTAWNSSTNWQSGVVPGMDDTAVFTGTPEGGDGNCTLTDSVDGVTLRFESGYAGTFATNGHALNLTGFDASQTVSGVIDLRNSTITNNGDFLIDGTSNTSLLVTGCTLMMTGGTKTNPAVFRESATMNIQRRFARIDFASSCFVQLAAAGNPANIMLNPAILNFYGHVECDREMRVYNTTTFMHSGCSVETTGVYRHYTGTLNGNDMSQFKASRLFLTGNTTVFINGATVPVETSTMSIAAFSATILPDSIFKNDVLFRTNFAGALPTVHLNNTIFEGNVTVSNDLDHVTVTGNMHLAGTADQTVDIKENAVGLEFDKPAGDVEVISGTFAASGVTGGKIDNNATMTVAADHFLETKRYMDHSTAVLTGAGTLRTQNITRL